MVLKDTNFLTDLQNLVINPYLDYQYALYKSSKLSTFFSEESQEQPKTDIVEGQEYVWEMIRHYDLL